MVDAGPGVEKHPDRLGGKADPLGDPHRWDGLTLGEEPVDRERDLVERRERLDELGGERGETGRVRLRVFGHRRTSSVSS